MIASFIFPTVITNSDIDSIPEDEHKVLLNTSYHRHKSGFMLSDNTWIMEDTPKLKEWITEQVHKYAREIMAISYKLKIGQSWCIKHKKEDQYIHSHTHGNSIISGSYYVDAPPGTAPLTFQKDYHTSYAYLSIDPDLDITDKPWASDHMEFPVKTGRLILFPSYLRHTVTGDYAMTQRCVLGFNTWFDGPWGSVNNMTRVE
jgi:uncharacterized protein (TIGR02466 family)